jgi:predicted Zn-ribbon and HTH transcriptional regulator
MLRKCIGLLSLAPLVLALAVLADTAPGTVGSGDGFILHGDTSIPDAKLIEQYKDKIPDTILLDHLRKKLQGVTYNHKKHVEMKMARCGNCHHKDIKDIKPCWQCHTAKPEDPKSPEYMKAYHGLCVECHKAFKAQKGLGDGDKPPDKKCHDCHPKTEGEGNPSGEPAPDPK